MRLTEAELEEGRRLLEAFISARDARIPNVSDYNLATMAFRDWFSVHADALLTRPEEIAREAVREFAEALFSHRVEVEDGRCSVIYEWRLVKEARARGVAGGIGSSGVDGQAGGGHVH